MYLQQGFPNRQDAVDLGRGEWCVQEPSHSTIRVQLSELHRDLHQLVVVHPHVISLLVHRRYYIREPDRRGDRCSSSRCVVCAFVTLFDTGWFSNFETINVSMKKMITM